MTLRTLIPTTLFLIGFLLGGPSTARAADCPAFLNGEYARLHSSERISLCQAVAGHPLLIVNTASHCGFTPQFKGLEAVHRRYRERGLIVIGFPSDDFHQEASEQAETAQVCFVNYGVTFTMLAPSAVRGEGANPVFRELARQSGGPKWNFNKYLVRADGTVLKHFDSTVAPESAEFASAVETLLR